MHERINFTINDVGIARADIDLAKTWLDAAASECEDSKTEEQLNKVIDALEMLQISIDSIIAQWKTTRTEAIA